MHDSDNRIAPRLERERIERIRTEWHALAGHVCRWYINARKEVIDPATQDGIGCTLCYPPDGRVHGDDPRPMHERGEPMPHVYGSMEKLAASTDKR